MEKIYQDKSNQEKINIALGFDEYYVPHAAAVIASILNSARGERYFFLIITPEISARSKQQLSQVARGHDIQFCSISSENIPKFQGKSDLSHINDATFLRLHIDTVAPESMSKIIYLDCDLIVTKSLADLWNIDLEDKPLGCVMDEYNLGLDFKNTWNLSPDSGDYFNAGVLVIDLSQVRREKLFAQTLRFVYENNPPYADQDALNYVFWGRWKSLPAEWNVQRLTAISLSNKELVDSDKFEINTPGIVHYTTGDKPWKATGYHPWSWLYWSALARTPFLWEVMGRSAMTPIHLARFWKRWLVKRWS